MMSAIIFDLDNTLYDVGQYFSGAFKEIAKYLSDKFHVPEPEIYKKLTALWTEKTSMYPHLFDDLLDIYNGANEIRDVIKIFNNYNGELTPYQDVVPTLKELRKRNYKLGIITDGDIERQKRKIKLLRLADYFDVIILAKELDSKKPSEIPYKEAVNKLNIAPIKSVYTGDNPLLDFEGAKKMGMRTIRILRGEFITIPKNQYIDYEINDLNKLLEIIRYD